MLTAIVGINWGDEGKGRMVDLLSQDYDIVVRYQGGNNAGHTVVNERGKFILNLLPSGILRPEVTCVMGNGMVIDLSHLHKEIASLREKGVVITPDNLKNQRPRDNLHALSRPSGLSGRRQARRREIRQHPPRYRTRLRRQISEKSHSHGRPALPRGSR